MGDVFDYQTSTMPKVETVKKKKVKKKKKKQLKQQLKPPEELTRMLNEFEMLTKEFENILQLFKTKNKRNRKKK